MPDYVWVRDLGTGHSGPMPRAAADALGDAVKVDPKHPTHDVGGELLRWVTKTDVSTEAAKKSGAAAAKEN